MQNKKAGAIKEIHITCICFGISTAGKTRPGQSANTTVGLIYKVWRCFVWPGVRLSLQILRPLNALIWEVSKKWLASVTSQGWLANVRAPYESNGNVRLLRALLRVEVKLLFVIDFVNHLLWFIGVVSAVLRSPALSLACLFIGALLTMRSKKASKTRHLPSSPDALSSSCTLSSSSLSSLFSSLSLPSFLVSFSTSNFPERSSWASGISRGVQLLATM